MSNPLTDLIPARYRKYLYAVAFVAGIVLAAYQANAASSSAAASGWKETRSRRIS